MKNYVHEIARAPQVGGQCLVTCYLRNREAERLIDAGKARSHFARAARFTYEGLSRRGNLFPRAYFLNLFARFGLEPAGHPLRQLDGREKVLSMQDIVVFRRRAGFTLVSRNFRKGSLGRFWRRLRTRVAALALKTLLRREYGWKLHAETYMNIKKAERLARERQAAARRDSSPASD